jgi:hypothetical protein
MSDTLIVLMIFLIVLPWIIPDVMTDLLQVIEFAFRLFILLPIRLIIIPLRIIYKACKEDWEEGFLGK